jgi:hypothetical protein
MMRLFAQAESLGQAHRHVGPSSLMGLKRGHLQCIVATAQPASKHDQVLKHIHLPQHDGHPMVPETIGQQEIS